MCVSNPLRVLPLCCPGPTVTARHTACMQVSPENRPLGLVLSGGVRFACAFASDPATIQLHHGGCDDWDNAWAVAYRQNQLATFVDACKRDGATDYNEVVFLKEEWEATLPSSIRAFACIRGRGRCGDVATAHANFLSEFGLSADAVPLVYYDPSEGFSRV